MLPLLKRLADTTKQTPRPSPGTPHVPSRPAPQVDKQGKPPTTPRPERRPPTGGRARAWAGPRPPRLRQAPRGHGLRARGTRGGADRSPAPPPLRSSLVVRFGSTGEGRGVGVPTPVLRGGRTVHEEGWVVPSFPAGEASSSGPHPDAGSRSAPLTSRSPKSGGPLGFARTELGWETRTSSPQDGGSQLMAWVCGGHRRRQGPEPPRPRGGRGLGEGRSQD